MSNTTDIAETAFVGVSNYVYFIAITAFVLSAIAICFKDVLKLLVKFPISMLESGSYLLFGTIIYYASSISPNFSHIVALPPALFVSATMNYTIMRILTAMSSGESSHEFKITAYNIILFGTNTLFYAGLAIYIDSLSMGYLSVICFMSLVGFNVGFAPGYIAIGYTNKNVIPSATLASLVVLLIGTYFKVTYPNILWHFTTPEGYPAVFCLDYFVQALFVPPMLWFGSFVYFISLLIMSSKLYAQSFESDRTTIYVQMQIVTIVSGLAAIYFGNYYDISQLYGMAGTIVTIYFAEKIYEVSPTGSGIYLIFLASALILLANTYLRSYLIENELEDMVDTYFNLYPRLK
jgi:hypothetical protein